MTEEAAPRRRARRDAGEGGVLKENAQPAAGRTRRRGNGSERRLFELPLGPVTEGMDPSTVEALAVAVEDAPESAAAWKRLFLALNPSGPKGGRTLRNLYKAALDRVPADEGNDGLIMLHLDYVSALQRFASAGDVRFHLSSLQRGLGGTDARLYLRYADFELAQGREDSARRLVQRGLACAKGLGDAQLGLRRLESKLCGPKAPPPPPPPTADVSMDMSADMEDETVNLNIPGVGQRARGAAAPRAPPSAAPLAREKREKAAAAPPLPEESSDEESATLFTADVRTVKVMDALPEGAAARRAPQSPTARGRPLPKTTVKKRPAAAGGRKAEPREKGVDLGDLSYITKWDPATWKRGAGRSKGATRERAAPKGDANAAKNGANAPKKETNAPKKETNAPQTERKGGKERNAPPAARAARAEPGEGDPTVAAGAARRPSLPLLPKRAKAVAPGSAHGFEELLGEGNVLWLKGTPFLKLGLLGRGGSSSVYRVLSQAKEVLALKRVAIEDAEPRLVEMYSNEITVLESLTGDKHVVQLIDSEVDAERGLVQLLMEMGETDLHRLMQSQRVREEAEERRSSSGSDASEGCSSQHLSLLPSGLSPNFVRLTWQQMLEAVHAMHEHRIVHGDLKPANFLFVKGRLKLIDFGIAKAIASDDTTNIVRDTQVGTLNYMSPEAILDTGKGAMDTDGSRQPMMKLGRPSDVWSLGCILYQLVYGKTPFAHLHLVAKLQAITNPKHGLSFPPVADPDLLACLQGCLRRNPAHRMPILSAGGGLLRHAYLDPGTRAAPVPPTPQTRRAPPTPAQTPGGARPLNLSRGAVRSAVSRIADFVAAALEEERRKGSEATALSTPKMLAICDEVYSWLGAQGAQGPGSAQPSSRKAKRASTARKPLRARAPQQDAKGEAAVARLDLDRLG